MVSVLPGRAVWGNMRADCKEQRFAMDSDLALRDVRLADAKPDQPATGVKDGRIRRKSTIAFPRLPVAFPMSVPSRMVGFEARLLGSGSGGAPMGTHH